MFAPQTKKRLDDDTLSFTLKTPWSDGTTDLVLSPLELIEKLAALVPPARLNLVRYHGVLAPNAANRDRIVPGPNEGLTEPCSHPEQTAAPQPVYRLSWSRLLARVFRQDVTKCPCGGTMKIIAALTEPLAIRTDLDRVGLASRAAPIAPPRPLPQTQFDYAS